MLNPTFFLVLQLGGYGILRQFGVVSDWAYYICGVMTTLAFVVVYRLIEGTGTDTGTTE